MGCTHYLTTKRNISKKAFAGITADVKIIEKFMKKIKSPLYCSWGRKKGVEYEPTLLMFNGCEAEGEDCETFAISLTNDDGHTFCKTNRRSYDLAVQMSLLSLNFHCPNSMNVIKTDASIEDWAEAIEIFEEFFPERKNTYTLGGKDNNILISAN